jgi:pimeloyl-ACP methyl ester carboxylesterase
LLLLLIALAVVIALVVAGLSYQALAMRADPLHFPAPGRLFDVGGYKLHLYEIGAGEPSVVLESGISASSLNWRTVQSEIAKFARVCSYDRAGLGWSDLSPHRGTPTSLADQLRALLQAAEVPSPYLLVGHSFGALVVHAFAAKYADETSGLVLVDPLDPAEWTPMTAEKQKMIARGVALSRRGALAARLGVVRVCLNLLMKGNRLLPRMAAKAWSGKAFPVTDRIAGQIRKMPPETWPLVAMHWKQPKSFEAMARHFECLPDSIAEVAKLPKLQAPVTLLSGGLNQHPIDAREYAARISSRANFRVAQRSGHWIQLDEPEVVVGAVRELIRDVRLAAGAQTR